MGKDENACVRKRRSGAKSSKQKLFYCSQDHVMISANYDNARAPQVSHIEETAPPCADVGTNIITQEYENPMLNISNSSEVYISHIYNYSEMYIQLLEAPSKVKCLKSNLEQIMSLILSKEVDACQTFVENIEEKRLYITRNNNSWCRVRMEKRINRRQVSVLYVDYGYSEVVFDSMLYSLAKISKTLNDTPPQALRVKLSLSVYGDPAEIEELIREMLPLKQPVLVKLIEAGDIPIVELCITRDGSLVSLNLTLRQALTTKYEQYDRDRRSVRYLPDLVFPMEGTPFKASILTATTPTDFVVKLSQNNQDLEDLESSMKFFYEKWNNVRYVRFKVGQYYAALFEGNWYRVYVKSMVPNGELAVVKFCDYGVYEPMSCKDMRPLKWDFRSLPQQIATVRLADVVDPIQGWTAAECNRFSNRVCGQEYICKLKTNGNQASLPQIELLKIANNDDTDNGQ